MTTRSIMGDPGSNLHEFLEFNNAMNGFMYQVQVNKAYLGSFGNGIRKEYAVLANLVIMLGNGS